MYDDHEKTGESTKGNGVNISLNDLTVTRILFIVNVITLCAIHLSLLLGELLYCVANVLKMDLDISRQILDD